MNKKFVIRFFWVFLATLVTVLIFRTITGYINQQGIVTTFILALLVSQIYISIFDPFGNRKRSSDFDKVVDDIGKVKAEIQFIKHSLAEEGIINIGELDLHSSIMVDIEKEEAEKNNA